MGKIRNYFGSWNKIEIGLMGLAVILILGVGIILKCELLSIMVAFLGIFSALNQAKGKVLGQFTGVVLAILYSYMSYMNRYYGEVIVYLFMILPLYIIGIYSWTKNKDLKTENVKQNDIYLKEWLVLIIVSIILFIGLYYLLRYFNTNQLIASTLSMIINLCATYLLTRRCKYSFIFYLVNAIILLFLWGMPVIQGNVMLLPMVFNAILLIGNNIYGMIKWSNKKV